MENENQLKQNEKINDHKQNKKTTHSEKKSSYPEQNSKIYQLQPINVSNEIIAYAFAALMVRSTDNNTLHLSLLVYFFFVSLIKLQHDYGQSGE